MATPVPGRMTRTEYLAWAEIEEAPHEFVDGMPRRRPDRRKTHHHVAMNACAALQTQLRGDGWFVFHGGAVAVGEDVLHPSIAVTRGVDALEGCCIESPVLVGEVVSRSTQAEGDDRSRLYRARLPSLRTCVRIAEDAICVEVFHKRAHGWTCRAYTRMDEVIEIGEPPCRLALAEIYAGLLHKLAARP